MRAIRFDEENLPLIAEYFDAADMMRIERKFQQKARNRYDFFVLEGMSVVFGDLMVSYYYVSMKQLTQHYDFDVILTHTKWFNIQYKQRV